MASRKRRESDQVLVRDKGTPVLGRASPAGRPRTAARAGSTRLSYGDAAVPGARWREESGGDRGVETGLPAP